jgi:hypothetical protein
LSTLEDAEHQEAEIVRHCLSAGQIVVDCSLKTHVDFVDDFVVLDEHHLTNEDHIHMVSSDVYHGHRWTAAMIPAMTVATYHAADPTRGC